MPIKVRSKKMVMERKNINFRTNYDEWADRVKSFGFGEKFKDGDLYEQVRGYIPTQKFYNKVYRAETGWRAITIRFKFNWSGAKYWLLRYSWQMRWL